MISQELFYKSINENIKDPYTTRDKKIWFKQIPIDKQITFEKYEEKCSIQILSHMNEHGEMITLFPTSELIKTNETIKMKEIQQQKQIKEKKEQQNELKFTVRYKHHYNSESEEQPPSLLEMLQNEIPSENKQQVINKKLMDKHREIMYKWTKCKTCQLIERLSITQFNPMNLNADISGKHNISITIFTKDGYAFGFFESRQLPYISNNPLFSTGKGNHFVYSLENPKKIPFRMKKKGMFSTQKDFICLYPNSEKKILFLVGNLCYVTMKGNGNFISQYISSTYICDKGYEYLDFVGGDTFEVDSVVTHKWS